MSLDTATGALADLGRLDDAQLYGRYIASNLAGDVYVGIGSAAQAIVHYDWRTGAMTQILPAPYNTRTDFAHVYRGKDGLACALCCSAARSACVISSRARIGRRLVEHQLLSI